MPRPPPVNAADGIEHHAPDIRGVGQRGGAVVDRVQGGIRFEGRVLPLDAHGGPLRRVFVSLDLVLPAHAVVARHLLGIVGADVGDDHRLPDSGQGQDVFPRLQIELQRRGDISLAIPHRLRPADQFLPLLGPELVPPGIHRAPAIVPEHPGQGDIFRLLVGNRAVYHQLPLN